MRSIRRPELGACVAVLVASCAAPPDGPRYAGAGHETPQRGGTFVFHHEDDVRSLDPHIGYDELSNIGLKLLFDGLLEYDRDTLELYPLLAEALPDISEDGRTFTFRLHRGVRFHHGRELVAEDVRWSMEHMLAPSTGSPGVPFFAKIEGFEEFTSGRAPHLRGITTPDRYTVRFTLTEPDQTFLNAMAMTFAHPVPHEMYERPEPGRHPIGTGPFTFDVANWEPGVRMTFERNPRYWRAGLPHVDRMVFELNLQRDAAFKRFRNGEIDHVHRLTSADFLFLRGAQKWAPYRQESAEIDLWGVEMNCEMAPFDDVHVRRAVGFALDRERWARARNGRLLPAYQSIPRSLLGYDEALPERQRFDLDAAREEMRLAGHPEGIEQTVQVWMTSGSVSRIYGSLLQSDLRRIGIQVEMKEVSFPVYLEETGKPRTAQMLFGGWSMDFPDPASFLDILFHSRGARPRDANNRAYYRNARVDSLIDRARAERDRARRAALYREADALITGEAPWAFMFSQLKTEAWQPYVHGYRPHPVWSEYFRDVWLDLPRHRIAQRYARDARMQGLAAAMPLGGLQ